MRKKTDKVEERERAKTCREETERELERKREGGRDNGNLKLEREICQAK